MAALTTIAALINVCLNLVLIPRYGLHGAVYSSIGSFLFLTIGLTFFGRRFVQVNVAWRKVTLYISTMVVLAALISALQFDNQWISFFASSFAAMIGYMSVIYVLDAELRLGMQQGVRLARQKLGLGN
jgi:O-antigen/teichoic acid export membrane protein